MELLREGRLPAGEIAAHFSMSGAAISKHLALLRDAGLVRDMRSGKFIYYEINTSVLEDVLAFVSGLRPAQEKAGKELRHAQAK